MNALYAMLVIIMAMTALTLCIPPGPYDRPADPDDRTSIAALRILRLLLVVAVLLLVVLLGRNRDGASRDDAASTVTTSWRAP